MTHFIDSRVDLPALKPFGLGSLSALLIADKIE